ncbi:pectinesterase [Breznakibacter xylanolyticus]|uniref:Pectinesterase n=1 Tax=Breznakibacter xylanolyticus TaxID=990 RepID=A0A2W7NFC9_9BACT|nr:alpha/beta hydrolase [Breznakibacter xylanolyticus]PZX18183.1 pectinesterase [Breznakibacter xylanolyticus]
MIRYLFSGIVWLFSLSVSAQHYRMHPDVPVDSSFTVANEYKKHIKKHPLIKVVDMGDTSGLMIHRNITYATLGERELHCDVFYPKTSVKKKRFPVVLIVHGGGWRSGDKEMDHPMAFELARRGYATICVEYRLSMEALYPAAIIDIKTALRWVRASADDFPFDTRRIAIQGTSAGGQMAALVGAINGYYPGFQSSIYRRYSDRVAAVVNIDGVLAFIHPESGEGKDTPGKPSAATLWFGKPVAQDTLTRMEASALTHVHKHSAPSIFINSSIPRFHGGRDDMIAKMKQWGIETRVYEHVDCMHTFWLFHPWFDETVNQIDSFLVETMKIRKR